MGEALLGELPALPLHEAGKYVAGAYIVLFALVLAYLAIMAIRLSRIERDLGDLLAHTREGDRSSEEPPAAAPEPGAGQRESTPA